ncbi:MAG: tetratricopeptide repeat protein [Myxococcota bacterium]
MPDRPASPSQRARSWTRASLAFALVGGLAASLVVGPRTLARADDFRFWVDANGVTHLTDDPAAAPPDALPAESEGLEALRSAWDDGVVGPPVVGGAGQSGGDADRVARLLRGALGDIERGEHARASATLRGVLRIEPRNAAAHWYLAQLARSRGRFDAAEKHLRQFLDAAGPSLERWRAEARTRLAAIADERRLADPTRLEGTLHLKTIPSRHFRLQVDAKLGAISADYAARVLSFLESARTEVSASIGVEPLEPLGVVLYGRAAYVREHAHRFTFQTVGFFDGRIHVASPAHPSETLRGVLFHEYTHAVFREHTGGDRPYWLNEGLAEQIERRSRGLSVSTRSERSALRANLETGGWIPLRSIAESFSGLRDARARDAYLQSVVTVGYIESRTDVAARRRLLERLGEGLSIDQALYEAMGVDTDGLDRAVQESIRSEFPEWTRTRAGAAPAAPVSRR